MKRSTRSRRRVFLEGGQQGLKRRGLDPEERELRRLQAKVGDMTMRLELAEHKLEKRGVAEDVRRRTPSRSSASAVPVEPEAPVLGDVSDLRRMLWRKEAR